MTRLVFLSGCLLVGLIVAGDAFARNAVDPESTLDHPVKTPTTKEAVPPTGAMGPPPVRAMEATTQSYVVKEGDTLGKISKKFLGDAGKWKLIARANQIQSPEALQVGTQIEIPTNTKPTSSDRRQPAAPDSSRGATAPPDYAPDYHP